MSSTDFRLVSPAINKEENGKLPRHLHGTTCLPKPRAWPLWCRTLIPEGLSGKEEEVGGEYGANEEGLNDWKGSVWRGPKMPNYNDRFEFRLYALDDDMRFDNQVTKPKLLDAIAGHVVGEAVFTATF